MTAYERAHEIYNAITEAQNTLADLTPEGAEYPSLVQISSRGHWNLAKRMQRAESREPGEVLPIYIVVQGTSRHYGGPEEGGWWYNWTETAQVFKVWTAREALRKVKDLREEYDQPRFGIYSAANRGEAEYDIFVTHDPSYWETRETRERPYYC
jgi:hypothetical protein